MAHRRDLIRMNGEEALAFLRAHRRLQVATLNPDGAPHLSTVWYALHESAVCFITYSKTQKIANLQRDPRITISVDAGDEYSTLQGVVIYGIAELLTGNDALPQVRQLLRQRGRDVDKPDIDAQCRAILEKRTVVTVQCRRMVSWDHRKLKGIY